MKSLHKTLVAVVAAGVFAGVFGAGFALGQQEDEVQAIAKSFDDATFETRMHALDPDDKQYAHGPDKLAASYRLMVRHPNAVSALLANEIERYHGVKEQAKSAMQVSQAADESSANLNLLMAVQNQRIIELLEQIKDKQ